jgi:predicted DsbA family dithiol-disulfide isomerase
VPHPRIRFAFDYVDPGSYLTHILLQRWRRAGDAIPEVDWTPLELRPFPETPVAPEEPAWMAMTRAMEETAQEMEIPFRAPGMVPRTRKAHEAALHALERGCHGEFHEALFRGHFVEGQDLGRVDVLVALAEEVGMDGSELRTVLGVDRFLPRVLEFRARALERGIRGVPTLELDNARLEGFTGVDRLRAFMTRGPVPGDGEDDHHKGRE